MGSTVGSRGLAGSPGRGSSTLKPAGATSFGRVRMEQRGEVLDLAPPGPELELAAAVRPDAPLLAVVVCVEQLAHAPEPRRLDVDRPRRKRQPFDVVDGVDDRVPGDPVAVRLQDRIGLLGQRRVLDERLREALRHQAVEPRVGRLVDDRAAVLALQVDRLDRPELRELGYERVVPRAARVELELQAGVVLEPPADAGARRRVAEVHRHDEADRPHLALDGIGERSARLPERQVERGALEGPAPGSRSRRPCPARSGTARADPRAGRRSRACATP